MNTKEQLLKTFEKEILENELSFTDLVSFDDLTQKDIDTIMNLSFKIAEVLKGEFKKIPVLQGKTYINFFLENSTRTRTSFELAGKNLGADVINISGDSSSMSKGETLLDTSITIDQMQADIIVVRAPFAGVPRFMANNVRASIINAGDGWNEHPTQALLDLFTLQRFLGKNLKGKKMLIVGDIMHSRVFGSLARMTKAMGIKVVVSSPHTLVQPGIDQWGISHDENLDRALKGIDIIYVLRLQTERAAAGYVPTLREYSKTYIINERRLSLTGKNTVVMHPGPVIREFDVHTNILEKENCLVAEEVFSGYCVRFALLLLMSRNRKNKKIEKRIY